MRELRPAHRLRREPAPTAHRGTCRLGLARARFVRARLSVLRTCRARRLQLARTGRSRGDVLHGMPPQPDDSRPFRAGQSCTLAQDRARQASAVLHAPAPSPAPQLAATGPRRARVRFPVKHGRSVAVAGHDRPCRGTHHAECCGSRRLRARTRASFHGRALPHATRPFPP
jgi:hypothetical protein